eukprot:12416738-Karenia_brevis.AAC.1
MATLAINGPEWWVSGKKGHLAPWAQATVWALIQVDKKRELWLTDAEIAGMVAKVGGGRPSPWSICKWRKVFANDED